MKPIFRLILSGFMLMSASQHAATCAEPCTSQRIAITSRMVIKSDSISSFIKIANPLIKATRAEKGCLQYEFLQDPIHPEVFFFYEMYMNDEARAYHSSQPYLSDFKKQRQPMLQKQPELHIYTIEEQ